MDDTTDPVDEWWELPPSEALNVAIIWADDLKHAAHRAKIVASRCEAAEEKLARCAAEVDRLHAERDALAAELDRDRHEFKPASGPFGCCGNNRRAAAVHRTARVVLAEQTEK